MSNFCKSLQAVLWASIGLGGRRADAARRVDHHSLPLILLFSLVLVLLLISALVMLARYAAGGA